MQNSSGIGDYFNICIVALGLSGNHPQPFWRSMYAYICMFIHIYINTHSILCGVPLKRCFWGNNTSVCLDNNVWIELCRFVSLSLSLSLSLFLPSLYLSLSIHRSTYPPLYNIYICARQPLLCCLWGAESWYDKWCEKAARARLEFRLMRMHLTTYLSARARRARSAQVRTKGPN